MTFSTPTERMFVLIKSEMFKNSIENHLKELYSQETKPEDRSEDLILHRVSSTGQSPTTLREQRRQVEEEAMDQGVELKLIRDSVLTADRVLDSEKNSNSPFSSQGGSGQ